MPQAGSTIRTAVAAMTLSAAAFVGIAQFESYRGETYVPVAGDNHTIGFGHTGPEVRPGQRITPEKALSLALVDVGRFEGAIRSCVRVPITQGEYDAFVSFAFNVGAEAFCGSTLVRLVNAGDHAGACAQLSRWTKFGNPPRDLPGLVTRRRAERAMCERELSGPSEAPSPTPSQQTMPTVRPSVRFSPPAEALSRGVA